MSTVLDVITAAALEVGAVQIGEPLTGPEQTVMLSTWQRLIDSMTLDRGNIHTVRIDTYPLVSSQPLYTMGTDPRATQISVSSVTNASVAVITLSAPHGITVGLTNAVVISGAAGLWQPINGNWVATAISATTLSIPLNTTSFGALTGTVTLVVAGVWDAVRPVKISTMNLLFSSGVQTPIFPIDWDEYADLALTVPPQPADGVIINPNPVVTGPPLKYYCDYNSPLATIHLYPEPDQFYYVVVYREQELEQVVNLTDTLIFARGYERYMVLALGIEAADSLGVTPSQNTMAKFAKAEQAVKGKNRKSPRLLTDPQLAPARTSLYNYRLGVSS